LKAYKRNEYLIRGLMGSTPALSRRLPLNSTVVSGKGSKEGGRLRALKELID